MLGLGGGGGGVLHDVLGGGAEHVPDARGEGHLLLGRGVILGQGEAMVGLHLLVGEEGQGHVPRAGLALPSGLQGALGHGQALLLHTTRLVTDHQHLEVELHLVDGGVEVLHAALEPAELQCRVGEEVQQPSAGWGRRCSSPVQGGGGGAPVLLLLPPPLPHGGLGLQGRTPLLGRSFMPVSYLYFVSE